MGTATTVTLHVILNMRNTRVSATFFAEKNIPCQELRAHTSYISTTITHLQPAVVSDCQETTNHPSTKARERRLARDRAHHRKCLTPEDAEERDVIIHMRARDRAGQFTHIQKLVGSLSLAKNAQHSTSMYILHNYYSVWSCGCGSTGWRSGWNRSGFTVKWLLS